jgi:hypothetical protein
MKIIQLMLFVCLSTVCVCAAEQPVSKDDLSRELVKIYGIEETVSKAKLLAESQARNGAQKMFAQFKSSMPSVGDAVWTKMNAAAERMIAKVEESWTPAEALKVWQDAYCSDMSVEELQQIIAASETPLGRKQIAAMKRASVAFQEFYVKRIKDVVDEAMKQYVTDLQQIEVDAASETK